LELSGRASCCRLPIIACMLFERFQAMIKEPVFLL
jgi:hypothetical protein